MQSAVTGAIGAAMVAGGVLTIIFSRHTAERRGRPETAYRYAWASVALWFGALPIVAGTHLPAKLRDVAFALLLLVGLAATLWFTAAGARARRAEFREHQREFVDAGRTPPRYFWTPWAIFGWTLGVGSVLVFGGGLAVGSDIGAFFGDLTAADVDRIAQNLANIIAASAFALIPISVGAGLWRWWSLRAEERVQQLESAELSN